MTLNNMDIATLVRSIRKYKYEILKSQSANLAAISAADMTRYRSFLATMTGLLDYQQANPLLDLPESAPLQIEIPPEEEVGIPENEFVYDLYNLLHAMETEMANSQSARVATNYISHDEKRIRDLILKAENLLVYAEGVTPLDLPESSPLRVNTGAGRTGV